MNQKTEITKLTNEILVVTMAMKDDFPEVYKHLGETPLFDSVGKKALNSNDFKEYLNTIQAQFKKISIC